MIKYDNWGFVMKTLLIKLLVLVGTSTLLLGLVPEPSLCLIHDFGGNDQRISCRFGGKNGAPSSFQLV